MLIIIICDITLLKLFLFFDISRCICIGNPKENISDITVHIAKVEIIWPYKSWERNLAKSTKTKK